MRNDTGENILSQNSSAGEGDIIQSGFAEESDLSQNSSTEENDLPQGSSAGEGDLSQTGSAVKTEPEKERVYAGFFVRLAAYIIDWIIVSAALLIIKIPVWIMIFSGTAKILTTDFIFQYSVYDILIYVAKVAYFSVLTYRTGATLGKRLFHLAVESMEDRKPTWFEIIYRESIGKFLSGLIICIGYILIAADKKKRGLHDFLCDTCVVYRHKKIVYVKTPVEVKTMQYRVNLPNRNVQE